MPNPTVEGPDPIIEGSDYNCVTYSNEVRFKTTGELPALYNYWRAVVAKSWQKGTLRVRRRR